MSQVQRQPNPYKPLIMENNYSEFACLIAHDALCEGELLDASSGYYFLGEDDRGLPIYLVSDDDEEVHTLECSCL